MKYTIIIVKIEEVTKKVSEWEIQWNDEVYSQMLASDTPVQEKQYAYQTTEKTTEEETKIYEQSTENEINLKKVIDAFNDQSNILNMDSQPGSGGGNGK